MNKDNRLTRRSVLRASSALALGSFGMHGFAQQSTADKWPDKWAKVSFWCLNIGLAWMVFGTLLPLGILQLYHSVGSGYFEARELLYVTNSTNTILEWGRMPGDLIFILGGCLPFLYITFLGVKHFRHGRTVLEFGPDPLFSRATVAKKKR